MQLRPLSVGFFISTTSQQPGNPGKGQDMTTKKNLQWHRPDEFDYSNDIVEKILLAGCLDATEFMPAGSMYSRNFVGLSVPTKATVKRGCEWTWLDEECRVEGRPVGLHDGWPKHGGQVFP